jgi:hypothetical protein
MPFVRDGHKNVTIRKGRRDVTVGPLLLEATNGTEQPINVNVLAVDFCTIDTIADWALKGEGLNSSDELLDVLSRFYPDININSEVTCIEFEVK